jgi:hypothetical protein
MPSSYAAMRNGQLGPREIELLASVLGKSLLETGEHAASP